MTIKRTYKAIKYVFVKWSLLTIFVSILFVGESRRQETISGSTVYHVQIGGTEVGTAADPAEARELFRQARLRVDAAHEGLTFLDAGLNLVKDTDPLAELSAPEELLGAMQRQLDGMRMEDYQLSYAVKISDFMVHLASTEEVKNLLQAAIDKYEPERKFVVRLTQDTGRAIPTLTAVVEPREEAAPSAERILPRGGVSASFGQSAETEPDPEKARFADYTLGVTDVDFAQRVEVAQGYSLSSGLTDLEQAISEATMEEAVPGEYVVKSGDTLSQIAEKVNIPMTRLVELNPDALDDVTSTIRVDQVLIITVPEPALSVKWTERVYAEESYDAPTEIIDRDDWYTTKTNVIRQPSAGFRRVIVDESFLNDLPTGREVVKQVVVVDAVAKIMERGTIVPPTYIKPIVGGRFSSGFGRRSAPTKGASTFHKGIDWATPTGTHVFASSGGTVAKAGWGKGYGYVVYIDHPDGRQTRYGHLSKILVSVGDKVDQGQTIALSGSTGVSTGPHIHFEILIGGTQVDPLKYIE